MNALAGKELSEARERRGWTQELMSEKLAESLGQTYSHRQYQKLEAGEFPKYKTTVVEHLDKLLGTKLYELVYGSKVPHETPRQEDRPRVVNEGESKYGESFSDRILRLMESNNRILEQQARTNTNLSETNRRLSDELINSRTESKNPLDDPSKWADLRELLADLASGKRFRSKQEAVAAIRSIFGAVEPKV